MASPPEAVLGVWYPSHDMVVEELLGKKSVRVALERIGRSEADIANVHTYDSGWLNTTACVTFRNSPALVAKSFRFERQERLRNEWQLLQHLRESRMRGVPTPVAFVPTAPNDFGVMFIDVLPGIDLFSIGDFGKSGLSRAYGQMGAWLRTLHERPMPDFLRPVNVVSRLDGQAYWLEGQTQFRMWVPAYRALMDSLVVAQPVLCHHDFHGGNVLFDTESLRLCGVVDWEMGLVADPLYDVAKALTLLDRREASFGDVTQSDRDAFLGGYGIDRDDSRLSAFRVGFIARFLRLAVDNDNAVERCFFADQLEVLFSN